MIIPWRSEDFLNGFTILISPTYLLISIILILSWGAWYLWRFILTPRLYPYEPAQLPYYIPWIGHTISFMRCPDALSSRGNKYFKHLEPYGITIAGTTTIMIRDTADLAAVWKNTTSLSYESFLHRLLTSFGTSTPGVDKVFHPNPSALVPNGNHMKSLVCSKSSQGKQFPHLLSEWAKRQLLPSENLVHLQELNLKYVRQVLAFERFNDYFISNDKRRTGQLAVTVSLEKFNRYMLSYSAFRTFFGEAIFNLDPNFAQGYQTWEDNSWKVFFNYPSFFIKDVHLARVRTTESIARYFDLPESERQPCWLFETMEAELKNIGVERMDRAGLIMMICWAINTNAHHLCFWIISHLLCNTRLLTQVQAETTLCCTSDDTCDVDKLLRECPTLDAVWHECLRLYNASMAARKAVMDCHIGGKTIHAGDQIFGPFRNWQLDDRFFGPNATEFDTSRWIKNKNLTRSRGFTPFGGGQTACPGRHFAQRETYSFIALLLNRFELQVTDCNGIGIAEPTVPRVAAGFPTEGIMAPESDMHITLKPR